MLSRLTGLLKVALLSQLFFLLSGGAAFAAINAQEELAEGKYRYLKSGQGTSGLTASWADFTKAMPNWKEKGKKDVLFLLLPSFLISLL